MALVSDISTYLAAQGLSLTVGTNLFNVPFPDRAPNAAVQVVEYAAAPAIRNMGASIGTPVAEVRRFQIIVRDVLANFATAQTLAQNIHNKLDNLAEATLSGVRYLLVRALQPPFYLGEDENARHQFACNYEALKERG